MCHRSWLPPIYHHMNWGTTRWSPSSCQPSTCMATSFVQKTWRLALVWRNVIVIIFFFSSWNIKSIVCMFFLWCRNSFSLKLPFLMFYPISSITPIKLSAWQPWRYGQWVHIKEFLSMNFYFWISNSDLSWLSGVCAQSLHCLRAE